MFFQARANQILLLLWALSAAACSLVLRADPPPSHPDSDADADADRQADGDVEIWDASADGPPDVSDSDLPDRDVLDSDDVQIDAQPDAGDSDVDEDCVPDCTGRQCGPDGCGGQCGPGCSGQWSCNTDTGRCDCAGRVCRDGTCQSGEHACCQSPQDAHRLETKVGADRVCSPAAILSRDDQPTGLALCDSVQTRHSLAGFDVTACVVVNFGAMLDATHLRVVARAVSEACTCPCHDSFCGTGREMLVFLGAGGSGTQHVQTLHLSESFEPYLAPSARSAQNVVLCRGSNGPSRDQIEVDSVEACFYAE